MTKDDGTRGPIEAGVEAPPPIRTSNPTAKGSAYLAASHGVLVVCGYAIHVILGRWLLPKGEYGLWVTIVTVLVWVELAVHSGTPPALLKILSEDHRRLPAALRAVWRLLLPQTLIVTAIFAALVPLIALVLLRDRRLLVLLWVAALDIPLMGLWMGLRRCLEGLHLFGRSAVAAVAYSVSRTVFVIAGVLITGSLVGAVVGNALSSVVSFSIALVWVYRRRRGMPDVKLDGSLVRRFLSFGVPMLGLSICGSFLRNTGMWTVKSIVGPIDEGLVDVYGAAHVVGRVPGMLCLGLSTATFAAVSAATARGDLAKRRALSRESLRAFAVVATGMCTAFCVVPGRLLATMFGERYAAGGATLVVLIVAAWVLGYMSLSSTAVAACGKPGRLLVVAACLMPVSVALAVLLVKWRLIEGGALAQGGIALVHVAAVGVLARRELGPFVPWATVARALAAAAAGLGAALVLPLTTGPWQLLRIPVALVVYAVALLVFGEIRRRDFAIIWDILGGRRILNRLSNGKGAKAPEGA